MKKVITVQIKASYKIEDKETANELYNLMTLFMRMHRDKFEGIALTCGGGFQIKERCDNWPNDTCDWCEKEFEPTQKGKHE